MNIFFYSIIWRQGKSSHACLYAKQSGRMLLTNDVENCTEEIYKNMFEPGQIITIHPWEPLSLAHWENYVIDFGGWVESRVPQAAKLSDLCVVPIRYQSRGDLIPAIKTIKNIESYNPNIVILINNTPKVVAKDLKETLQEHFPNHPVFIINPSKYIARMADENLTPFELYEQSGTDRYALRYIIPQLIEFHTYLDNFKPNDQK